MVQRSAPLRATRRSVLSLSLSQSSVLTITANLTHEVDGLSGSVGSFVHILAGQEAWIGSANGLGGYVYQIKDPD